MQLPLGEMTRVELPSVPHRVSAQDVDSLAALRQKHKQELHAFEDETRRQRHQLRKLKKARAERSSVDSAENIDPNGNVAMEEISADDKAIIESARANMRELEEAARAEKEQYRLDCATLEANVLKLREQRAQEERVIQQIEQQERSRRDTLIEEPQSSVPSGAPSAVSSAAPSRSSSPTGSVSRCPSAPTLFLADIAEQAPLAESPEVKTGRSSCGKGAPPPLKGKGKGKGAVPVPPPPNGLKTPRQSLIDSRVAPRTSKYVNLFWKATQKPEVVEESAFDNDPYLEKFSTSGIRAYLKDMQSDHPLPEISVPPFPETVFSCGAVVEDLPEELIEEYFKRSESSVRLPQLYNANSNPSIAGRTNLLGDQKRLNMIGIMLQKHIMQHREENNREAILNIKRSVLQCDFDMVKLECLSVIRTVLRQHVKDGSPISSHVQAHGEASIWDLAYPDHHYLVYELSKVPQVDERLECMMFRLGFSEMMVNCKLNIKTAMKALEALKAKRHLIQRFFVTAHRLGQSLSQSRTRGFQLSTLEKLTQTKSTKMPHLSILHFVLAGMKRQDAEELFTDEDIALLRSAKALGTAKVREECRELAEGLYGVKQICDRGEYPCLSTGQSVKIERRRKTLPPKAAAAALHGQPQSPQEDPDDLFHEVMRDFVESTVDEATDIVFDCHQMLLLYKELALFFDDLNNVYPPPKDPSDKRLDLLDVFHRFAMTVPKHREEVEEEGLRELIGNDES